MKSLKFFFLTVFAGMMFVSCNHTDPLPNNSLVGKWAFVDLDGITLEITDSVIMFMPVVPNPVPSETREYKWISNDSIEITSQHQTWGVGTTHNKVIFHTPDSVTITGWYYGTSPTDEPLFRDVPLKRIGDLPETLNLNFQQIYNSNDFSLKFDSVLNDSRCPSDWECDWAGNAEVKFIYVDKYYTGQQSFVLNTLPNFRNDTTIGNVNIKLVELSPYPSTATMPIPQENYVAKVLLTTTN